MATKKKTAKAAKKTAKPAAKAAKPAAKAKTIVAKPAAPKASLSAAKKTRTKSEIVSTLADQAGISKKDVGTVLETLQKMIGMDIGKGSGVFNLPGLMKITVKRKPATKARKGTNPFTGEEMTFSAKPARNVVRIRPLKALKDSV